MAFNPLPWYVEAGFRPERTPPYVELLARIKAAGYDAVPADVPAGSTAAQFAELLDGAGMRPAPGYFETALSDVDQRDEAVERATRAAADHAALGLDRIFLADRFGGAAPRFAVPGRGMEPDRDRLAVIIESVAAIARAMVAEGVRPCLHPHVGTWIETADEGSAVLDAVPADLLLAGPDTGHLTWAGGDPAAFVTRHRDRIGGVHIKDVHASVVRESAAAGRDYMQTNAAHVWTEPGRGDIDLDAVLAALAGFDGWFIVEVDVADQPTVDESARVSAAWLRPRLPVLSA